MSVARTLTSLTGRIAKATRRALVASALGISLAAHALATGDDAVPAAAAGADARPLCLYVSSYHVGNDWSDGIERGLRTAIGDACTIERFDMDTKRRRTKAEIEAAAAAAHALFERLEPDIVITSDDNAAKHLVVPYLVDGPVPVVFSGVNWTVEEYGFPASNVTGIVEVAPIRPLLREALTLAPGGTRAVYVGALTLSQLKNYARLLAAAEAFGVTLDSVFVESLGEWKNAFDFAQGYDFVIVGDHQGIDDWDGKAARAHALAATRRPSLTNHGGMMPYSIIGYTKLPEEHGERAGATALAILGGTAVRDIPLVTNREWDVWLNVALASRLDVPIPERVVRRAKEIDG